MLAAFLIYVYFFQDNLEAILATASIMVLGSLRLLPSLTKISASMQSIRGSHQSLNLIHSELVEAAAYRSKLKSAPNIDWEFRSEVRLDNVSYKYPSGETRAIMDVELTIKKGECVGLVGPSGSGKSTLIDILLGFLPPEKGNILVDGRDLSECLASWQSKIGYVPQFPFLNDGSVMDNIILGDPYDPEKMKMALAGANLADWADKLERSVGEHGESVSGGQRQRIAIARALYRNPSLLVFDEATSALDADIEKEITNSIEKLKGHKTIIVVSHRSTLLGFVTSFTA